MVLILFNLLLVVLSYVSYKKALKTNFPVSRGQAYVISGDQYGWVDENEICNWSPLRWTWHGWDWDPVGISLPALPKLATCFLTITRHLVCLPIVSTGLVEEFLRSRADNITRLFSIGRRTPPNGPQGLRKDADLCNRFPVCLHHVVPCLQLQSVF